MLALVATQIGLLASQVSLPMLAPLLLGEPSAGGKGLGDGDSGRLGAH